MAFNISEFSTELVKHGTAKAHNFSVIITPPAGVDEIMQKLGVQSWLPLRIESVNLPSRSLMTFEQRYHGPTRFMPYSMIYTPVTLSIILSETMIEREFFMAWQDLVISVPRGPNTTRKNPSDVLTGGGRYDTTYYDESIKHGVLEIRQFAESPTGQGAKADNSLLNNIIGVAQAVGLDPSQIANPLGLGGVFDSIGLDNPFASKKRAPESQYSMKLLECWPRTVNEVSMNWGTDEVAKLQVEMMFFELKEEHKGIPEGTGENFPGLVRKGIQTLGKIRPLISGVADGSIARNLAAAAGSQIRNLGDNLRIT